MNDENIYSNLKNGDIITMSLTNFIVRKEISLHLKYGLNVGN